MPSFIEPCIDSSMASSEVAVLYGVGYPMCGDWGTSYPAFLFVGERGGGGVSLFSMAPALKKKNSCLWCYIPDRIF